MKKFDYNFKALGTACSLSIIDKDDESLKRTVNLIYDNIVAFENEFSRFKKDSALSKLNIEKKLEVSENFLSMIDKSREISALTGGYFNPLIDIRKIGYFNSFDTGEFKQIDLTEDLNLGGIKSHGNILEIGKNMNLDFGSIAKGFLADKISDYLRSRGFRDFLVNLGGDIYASGSNLYGNKWRVGISSPFDKKDIYANLELSDKSISTSGTYLRKWQIDNEDFHHIRNPFSPRVEDELLSASIIDDHGYKTDALATGLIAMGKVKALEFCEKNEISYLFILQNKGILTNLSY